MAYKFKSPKLRSGVTVSDISSQSVEINYKNISMQSDFESVQHKEMFISIVNNLQVGQDSLTEDAIGSHSSAADFAENVLQCLDSERLLIENPIEANCISGIDFAFLLEDLYYNKWKYGFGESDLTKLILNGDAPREVIIGWALEYYHVTKGAHDAILSVIPNLTGELKCMALEFFEEEFRHDKMMLKALTSIGIDVANLSSIVPLPATAAYINILEYWAVTDPLTFLASIFIYEGEKNDYEDYIGSLLQYEFSESFVKPQKTHNDINVDGDHFGESRRMLGKISAISSEQEAEVIKNLVLILNIERELHDQILGYYSSPYIGVPRRLENA